MDAVVEIRCSHNHSHASFNLDKKRCRTGECSAGLEKLCHLCEQYSSYSNAAKHTKKCRASHVIVEEEHVDAEDPLRIVYLTAGWRDGVASGQYHERLPDGFPAHFRVLPQEDCNVVDAYDAIWGTIVATNERFQLVHSYTTLGELVKAIKEGTLSQAMDILVVNDWIHTWAMEEEDDANTRADVEELLCLFRNLEVDRGIRIFPPLDYSWYFAQKAHFLNHMAGYVMPPGSSLIPTITVPNGERAKWKRIVRDFVEKHRPDDNAFVMIKREMSGKGAHVIKMDINDIQTLEGRSAPGGFRWIAQPFISEFSDLLEFRMCVLNGRCRWGVATRSTRSKDGATILAMLAVAPGRRIWEQEGGREAASIAESVVVLVAREQPHAAHFLRVDMVRKRDPAAGWWINELEFFGNAFIHFEAFDNSPELLESITKMTTEWVLQLCYKPKQ